jgi:molybdopterin-guanine dinucleotide biosynthesis protein A
VAPGRALVAVLAGGAGSRLGGRKASAELAGRPLIDWPLAAAQEAALAAVVVAKPDTELPRVEVPVLREPAAPRHPLAGVVCALRHAQREGGERAVIAVGCDMPFVTGALLAWMARLDGSAMAVVGGRAQPLPARVATEAAPALERALEREAPLRAAIAELGARLLDGEELKRFGAPERLLFSVNTPVDMATAEAWLRAGARTPG